MKFHVYVLHLVVETIWCMYHQEWYMWLKYMMYVSPRMIQIN